MTDILEEWQPIRSAIVLNITVLPGFRLDRDGHVVPWDPMAPPEDERITAATSMFSLPPPSDEGWDVGGASDG